MSANPQRSARLLPGQSLFLIAASLGLAIVGAVAGNWLVVTAMVLSLAFQVVNVWMRWRRRSEPGAGAGRTPPPRT
jgi:hypothetical protein